MQANDIPRVTREWVIKLPITIFFSFPQMSVRQEAESILQYAIKEIVEECRRGFETVSESLAAFMV